MIKNKINKTGILLLLLLFINGCASTGTKLTKESRLKIKDVAIGEVHLPNKPTYKGLFSAFSSSIVSTLGGFEGGAIGGLAVSMEQDSVEADKSDAGKIKYFLKENNIDIKQIFAKSLEQKILSTNIFKYTTLDKSDAKFKINVISYGLNKAPMSFSSLMFFMTASIKLIDNNNKIVWEVRVKLANDGRKGYDDWLNNPEYFNKSIRVVVNKIVKNWFNDLN